MQHIAIKLPGRPISAPLLIECDGTREGISLAVEALIARLDVMDGDPDLEDYDTDLEDNGDDGDSCGGEDERPISNEPRAFARPLGAGCEISDPADDDEDRELLRFHRDRIRATRCDRVGRDYNARYVLRETV